MTQITKLTQEQEDQLIPHRDKWIGIGLSTEKANRKLAEEGVKEAYIQADVTPTDLFIWADSPMTGVYLAALLQTYPSKLNFIRHRMAELVGKSFSEIKDYFAAEIEGYDKAVVKKEMHSQFNQAGYGQHGAGWLSFYDFFRVHCELECCDKITGLVKIAENAGWFWPFDEVCVITERPNLLKRDKENRLHCPDGPALSYPDGFALYRWHGLEVPEWIILTPELITPLKITKEDNVEVRRAMMEIYGYENYITNCEAEIVDSCPIDHHIIGLRDAKLLVKRVKDDETIVYIDLLNSTPEPDGTVKRYLLRVDPDAYKGDASRYCQAAVASTWRNSEDGELTFKDWKDYIPDFES